MEKILWSEEYETGIQVLDQQHKNIIKLINKLIDTKSKQVEFELIMETLLKMTQYAIDHLQAEENLMLEYDYPDYENHKKEHKEFRKKTISFSLEKMSNKDKVMDEIILYLKQWWVNHILNTDQMYSSFFLQKGVN